MSKSSVRRTFVSAPSKISVMTPLRIPDEKASAAEIIAYINDRIVRSQTEMISENLMITPNMAQVILDKYNTSNRPFHLRDIARYTKSMLNNEWILTAQGMSFNKKGALANGQNRSRAIVESGVTCQVRITFGEEDEAFHATDTGAKRTGSDTLALLGYPSATTLAAAVRILHNISNDTAKAGVTNKEILETITLHPGMVHAVQQTLRFTKLNIATGAAVAYYLIETQSQHLQNDPSLLSDFFTKLEKGENLSVRNPILTIRSQLFRKTLFRTQSNRMQEASASIILCWNAYVLGRTPSTLQWKITEFPVAL